MMEEVMTKPKQSYVFDPEGGFDHKLTDEEIEELIENYDYSPDFEDDGVLFDGYDNPTESMIRWEYEKRHGLAEYEGPFTSEEFDALMDEWRKEVDDEDNNLSLVV